MARIRSVHPDLCVSPTMAKLTAELERTFVRLLIHCDDDGRCVDNSLLIKAAIYPLHNAMTAQRVDKDLDGLLAAGLILRYSVDGKRVIAVTSWSDYQHPQRATPSKLPGPDSAGVVHEPSAIVPRALHAGVGEGEGEGIGEGEGAGAVDKSTRAVFDAWVEATGRDKSRTKFTDDRRRHILKALKTYELDELIDAVRGVTRSSFHMGRNDNHRRYDELDLILRDGSRIEQFRDLWRNPRPVVVQDRALEAIAEDRAMRGAR